MTSFEFKKDKFKKARGQWSRFLNINCRKCKALVAVYQKDGPGNLRRMYIDRIFLPKYINDSKMLKCKSCGEVLGTPYVYEKEGRMAFRLYVDAVTKEIRKKKDKSA